MKSQLFIFIALIFLGNLCMSQIKFSRDTSIYVYQNSVQLKNAWNGGINSAQFCEIDLNLDGTKDILIFDRSGNKLSPYINVNGKFIFAPEYRNDLPKISSWIIMEDYNCDGMNDIFTYSNAGISVYINTSSNKLSFSMSSNHLVNNLTGQVIYVSPMDIPAIADIDYDGDLDILTFEITGGFVNYFKNKSVDNFSHCDSLIFENETGCWGNFYEGLNTYVLDCFNCLCPPILSNINSKNYKHAGSSLLSIDIDGDNDKDLVLGDVSFRNLNLLINGGDNQNAHIISVDTSFPSNFSNTIPVDISIFPSAFFMDVTSDNNKDLIVTTNMQNNSENKYSCWLYENTGNSLNPEFQFIQDNFIQSSGIDLGEGAYPTFYDYNQDGLADLFVGNYGYHNINGNPTSKIAYFENIGTIQNPTFSMITDDFENISNINLNTNLNIPALNLNPTFGDLDGDNDKDLIIGDADGKIHLFENNNNNFTISSPNFENIDVGYYASPQIIDVNRDGLNDIIIGNKDGTIYYFENKGTATNPDFSTSFINWGDIDVDSSFISNGFSTPKLIDINGEYHLISGSFSGKIYGFNNIDGNLYGKFNEILINNDIWEGGKSAIALQDINNDLLFDLIIGNQSGGLAYFIGDSISNTSHNILDKIDQPYITNNTLVIKNELNTTYMIFTIDGKKVISSKKNEIDLQNLSIGMYILQYNDRTYKFIK